MGKLIIVGSGVVGQATGKGFITKGHDVIFSDINLEVLAKLKTAGYDVCPSNLLEQETDIEAFFLTVSTPTIDGKIHLNFLIAAVSHLGTILKCYDRYSVVIVRSTVPPGTTKDLLIPLLEQYSGKKAGQDFGICMNPEYLRENRNETDFVNPWLITIGQLDERSGDTLDNIYHPYDCPVSRITLEVAEMQKYVHNIFNANVISFFNEMRRVCEAINVDADTVFELVRQSAEASWNPQYGIQNHGAYGGSCLPKDTTAFLTWAKTELGMSLPLLRATIKVNNITKELQHNSMNSLA